MAVVIKSTQITPDLLQKISVSKDQDHVHLTVDYKQGRFIIERSFPNNFGGLYMLDRHSEKFDSEEKVSKYLKIGEYDERIKS